MSEDQKVKNFENIIDFLLYALQRFQSEAISFYLSTTKPNLPIVWTVDVGNESVYATRGKPAPPFLLFVTMMRTEDAAEDDRDPALLWLRELIPQVSKYSISYNVLHCDVEVHSNLSFVKKVELTIYGATSALMKRNPDRVNYAIAKQNEDRLRNLLMGRVPDGYCALFKSDASYARASTHIHLVKMDQVNELNSLVKSFFRSQRSQREELEMLIKQLEQEIEQKKRQLEELREALWRLEEINKLKESLLE